MVGADYTKRDIDVKKTEVTRPPKRRGHKVPLSRKANTVKVNGKIRLPGTLITKDRVA